MTALWIILAVVAVALIAAYIDLYVVKGHTIMTPLGPWHFRTHSLWPRLFGSDGFTAGGCSHFRPGHKPTGVLCGHECFHAVKQNLQPPDLAHYVVSKSYRDSIEGPAKAYGLAHGTESEWIAVAVAVSQPA